MNEHVRLTSGWTTAELERLVDLGVLDADQRIELIGGEIVPMSPTGEKHEDVADEFAQHWVPPLRPADVRIGVERQFNLDAKTYTTPDIVVRPAGISSYRVRGDTALLVVEVADSSWAKDIGIKAATYAAFGVREYWMINAETLIARVHREPAATGYASIVDVPPSETLTPLLVPGLAVRLADLARR